MWWSRFDFFGDLARRTRLILLSGLLFLGLSFYFAAIGSFESATALQYQKGIYPTHRDWGVCRPLELFGIGREGILKSSYNRHVCATLAAPISFGLAFVSFLIAGGLLAFRRR